MSFPVAPGVGIGTGQPTRADFESPAYQDLLRPGHSLDLPKQTVPQSKERPKSQHDLSQRSGWQRQEALYEQGGRSRGAVDWERFSGRQARDFSGLNQGAVKVDNPLNPSTQRQAFTPPTPENWAEHAAVFEERFRQVGEKVGLDTELRLPGEGPAHTGPTGTGRRNQRRSFTLT